MMFSQLEHLEYNIMINHLYNIKGDLPKELLDCNQ